MVGLGSVSGLRVLTITIAAIVLSGDCSVAGIIAGRVEKNVSTGNPINPSYFKVGGPEQTDSYFPPSSSNPLELQSTEKFGAYSKATVSAPNFASLFPTPFQIIYAVYTSIDFTDGDLFRTNFSSFQTTPMFAEVDVTIYFTTDTTSVITGTFGAVGTAGPGEFLTVTTSGFGIGDTIAAGDHWFRLKARSQTPPALGTSSFGNNQFEVSLVASPAVPEPTTGIIAGALILGFMGARIRKSRRRDC
jgi:hypothetical protein